MTDDGQGWEQPPQYPPQGYGQQGPQGRSWQPQQYGPGLHQERAHGQPPQQQYPPQPPPHGDPRYAPPYPQQPQPPQGDPWGPSSGYSQQQRGLWQQPYQRQGSPPPHRRKSWPARHKLLSGLIAAGAIVIIAVAASASGKPSAPAASTGAAASSASPSAAVSSAPASSAPRTPAAPASAPVAPAAPASPPMTGAQQQAVDAAQEYLSEGQGFSAQGLLQQLTSSAGNGFSKPDAEFAIKYLSPNWDTQAVDAARGYLSGGQGFSDQGLVQQLTSSAGSGFTEAQAEYAVSSLHPDWDAQAVDAAQGYMQMGGFSRASLIQQLTSSAGNGFTQAQAEYAASKVGL